MVVRGSFARTWRSGVRAREQTWTLSCEGFALFASSPPAFTRVHLQGMKMWRRASPVKVIQFMLSWKQSSNPLATSGLPSLPARRNWPRLRPHGFKIWSCVGRWMARLSAFRCRMKRTMTTRLSTFATRAFTPWTSWWWGQISSYFHYTGFACICLSINAKLLILIATLTFATPVGKETSVLQTCLAFLFVSRPTAQFDHNEALLIFFVYDGAWNKPVPFSMLDCTACKIIIFNCRHTGLWKNHEKQALAFKPFSFSWTDSNQHYCWRNTFVFP